MFRPKEQMLVVQANLAQTLTRMGRVEQAVQIERDVYYGYLKVVGEENRDTSTVAINYSASLIQLQRFEEARLVLRKTLPVARRVLGENHENTLRARGAYALALYRDAGATLDDLREAVTTIEEIERTARRAFGGGHPNVAGIGHQLREARAALRARETPSPRRGSA